MRYFGVAERDLPDTLQEVFIVVHRKLHEFEGRSDIKTWLFRICANTASDYRRRAYRNHERLTPSTPEGVAFDDPHTKAASNEQISRLLAALDKLCAPQRRVFIMYEIQGRPVTDIALVEGCAPKTVFTRLYAARKFLLEHLRVDDERLCFGLVTTNGRWIDTAGIEQALLTAKPASAGMGSSGLASLLIGKPYLISISTISLVACFMIVNPFTSEDEVSYTSFTTPNIVSVSHTKNTSVSSTLSTLQPSEDDSHAADLDERVESIQGKSARLTFSSAEVRPRKRYKSINPIKRREQNQEAQAEGASVPVDRVTDEDEVDFVVYRTGQLDRTLPPSDSASQEEHHPITDPVYRDYSELANLTEQQINAARIKTPRRTDRRSPIE